MVFGCFIKKNLSFFFNDNDVFVGLMQQLVIEVKNLTLRL
jgi:hypothetical protein